MRHLELIGLWKKAEAWYSRLIKKLLRQNLSGKLEEGINNEHNSGVWVSSKSQWTPGSRATSGVLGKIEPEISGNRKTRVKLMRGPEAADWMDHIRRWEPVGGANKMRIIGISNNHRRRLPVSRWENLSWNWQALLQTGWALRLRNLKQRENCELGRKVGIWVRTWSGSSRASLNRRSRVVRGGLAAGCLGVGKPWLKMEVDFETQKNFGGLSQNT